MTKRLLHGVIDFDGGLSQESMTENLNRLTHSGVSWVQPEDERIFRFVSDFFESELEVPNSTVMFDYFDKINDVEATERLKDIQAAQSHEGGNYRHILKGIVADQKKTEFLGLLKTASATASKGIRVKRGYKEVRLEGVEDAFRELQDSYDQLVGENGRPVSVVDAKEATGRSLERYIANKAGGGYGLLSGIEPIDVACGGLRPGEIWIHAAHSGEMKTTLAQNVVYNAVTWYRRNVVYVSLEMPEEQMLEDFHVLHSAHPRWGKRPLENQKVRRGELTDVEEQHYQAVLEDFRDNPEYCRLKLITANEPLTMPALRRELDRLHREIEIGLVVIDHSELLVPPEKSDNHGVAMNSIYKALRELSLHFDGGKGLPILCLHQTNRQGKDKALKDGRYTSTSALSWANEAERSATLVTYGYLDEELRASNLLRVGCLKNRYNPFFADFVLQYGPSKRLSYDTEAYAAAAAAATADGWSEDYSNLV